MIIYVDRSRVSVHTYNDEEEDCQQITPKNKILKN